MLGNLISLIADKNESRSAEEERYDRRIFKQCLVEVVGVASEADVDHLGVEDLLFFRLFDLRSFQGDEWEERAAIKTLLV